MIATGMATVIASPAASRTLRSRTSRPTREGPTPFPAGMPAGRGSIGSSLLGFGDFGADAVEKRPLPRQLRMLREQRARDFIRLDQQILAFAGRRRVRAAPEVALGAVGIAGREPRDRQTAALAAVALRIAALSFFVRGERVAVSSGEEQRVPE